MSENDASGNRWEPDTEKPADPQSDAANTEAAATGEEAATGKSAATSEPAATSEAAEPAVPAYAPVENQPRDLVTRSSWASRGKVLAAAAAAGVFLVGGLSGFAVGRSTGDGGHGDRSSFGPPQGFPGGGFDRDGDGARGQGGGDGGYGGPGAGPHGFGGDPGTQQGSQQGSQAPGTSS